MSKTRKPWHAKLRWQAVTKLMARDGLDCTICKEPLDRSVRDPHHARYITFDHIIPRSSGGLDDLKNKRLAHRRCNEQRGNDPVMPGRMIGNTVETDLIGELVEVILTGSDNGPYNGGQYVRARGRVRAATGTADGHICLWIEVLDEDGRHVYPLLPPPAIGDLVLCSTVPGNHANRAITIRVIKQAP